MTIKEVKMNKIKEFFRPTQKKITFLLLLMIITGMVFIFLCKYFLGSCAWEPWMCTIFCDYSSMLKYYLILMIPNYLISCLIIFIYQKNNGPPHLKRCGLKQALVFRLFKRPHLKRCGFTFENNKSKRR